MRLSQQTIAEITGFVRKSSQRRWFKDYMGIDVPYDKNGVILTESAYDALVKKRIGVLDSPVEQSRPKVRLVK